MSFALTDAVTHVLGSALDGITLRQNVIADNIANVDTPGFRAVSVDFETALRSAIGQGQFDGAGRRSVPVSRTPTDTPVGSNGNNVDLRHETLAAIQSQVQYQMMTRAVNDKYALVRTAVSGH